jgi:nitroreductase
MSLLDVIFDRRSIRKFLAAEIPEEIIVSLLKAGMYAPSARNTQSWHFLVVRKRPLLDAIMDVHPYAKMLKYAPIAILVCGDKSLEENIDYLNQNCSAATQNILLAATAIDLGSVWLGVYPRNERVESLQKLFELPSHIIPISLIAIGYPDEVKLRPDRFIPARIHYDKW